MTGTMPRQNRVCQTIRDIRDRLPVNPSVTSGFVSGRATISPTRRIAARIVTNGAHSAGTVRAGGASGATGRERKKGGSESRAALSQHEVWGECNFTQARFARALNGPDGRCSLLELFCLRRCHGRGVDIASASFRTVVIQRFFNLISIFILLAPASICPVSAGPAPGFRPIWRANAAGVGRDLRFLVPIPLCLQAAPRLCLRKVNKVLKKGRFLGSGNKPLFAKRIVADAPHDGYAAGGATVLP